MDTAVDKYKSEARANRAESIHLNDLLQIIKLRRNLLYVFTIMTLCGTIFRQILYVPTYTAQTSLTIQKAENSPMQMALANITAGQMDSSDQIQKYVRYLSSSEFYLAVAQTLKFQEGYQQLNLTNPAEMSFTRKKFWIQYLGTHFGRSTDATQNANPEPVLMPVEALASYLQSVTVAEAVGSDSLRLKVTTLDAFTSMVLANTASDVFVKKTGERDYNDVSEVKRFIQSQLESTTERLKRSELTLVEFKKSHNIISIGAGNTAFASKLTTIDTELESTKLKYAENEKLVEYYSAAIAKGEKKVLAQGSASVHSSPTEMVSRLRQTLDSLRYKKVLMQAQGYAEDSWQMSEMNREIDKTATQLKTQLASPELARDDEEPVANLEVARTKIDSLKTENHALDTKIVTIEKSRGELLKVLGTLPKDEQVLLTLTRDVDLQFELYSSLKKKLQEVEIQQVALQSHVSIGGRSGLPPPAPRTNIVIKLLFALLVGVFMGGSMAFLLEAIDPTVKHRADLEALELITLGSIPHVEGSPIRKTLGGQSYRPDLLICKEKPESPESMAFKHVRAQLTMMRSHDGKPAKIISITSAERGDGKTFVAANLAVSISQLEKRTILIDCDFRNPSLPWMFGYKEGDGLSSLLTLKSSLDEILVKDRIPNLDILPSGWTPPNPTELLSNDKFRILLDHLKGSYDYIIIDSPPSVPVVDAAVLANLADAVIMVAGFRKTKKDLVLLGLRKILQISHKHVYAILNNVWEVHEYRAYAYPGEGQPLPPSNDTVDVKSELSRFEQSLNKRNTG